MFTASLLTDRPSRLAVAPLALLAGALAGCGNDNTSSLDSDVELSLYALVRTVDGTYFHPPLGPTPTTSGHFDSGLLSKVRVDLEAADTTGASQLVASFDSNSSPAVRLIARHEMYFVNVPASTYFTNPQLSYSFRIRLNDREIGRSDLSGEVFDVLARYPNLKVGVKVRIEDRAAPVLSAITPVRVSAGAGVSLTVSGAFASDSVVRLGDHELQTSWVSGQQLVAVIPPALVSIPGFYPISVSTPGPGGGTTTPLAFNVAPRWSQLYDVLAAGCSCHMTGSPGGLSLRDRATAYANLVGHTSESSACAGGVRVVPGDAASSVLYRKLSGVDLCGPAMPREGATWKEGSLGLLRAWIDAGAANN